MKLRPERLRNLSKVTQPVTGQNQDQSSRLSVSKAPAISTVPQGPSLVWKGRGAAQTPSSLVRDLRGTREPLQPGSTGNSCTNMFFFHFLASHQVPEKPEKSIKYMEKEIVNLKKDLMRSRWVSPRGITQTA